MRLFVYYSGLKYNMNSLVKRKYNKIRRVLKCCLLVEMWHKALR